MSGRRTFLFLLLVSLLPVWAVLATGSDTVASQNTCGLTIESSPDSAGVFLNGVMKGRTPFRADSLTAGLYHIRIEHPDASNWLSPVATDSVRLEPGERKSFRFTLAGGIIVYSDPDGASVFLRDSLLGQTPLVFLPGHWSPTSNLEVRKNGYERAVVTPAMAIRGILRVPLTRAWTAASEEDSSLVDNVRDSEHSARLYIISISGGVAVLATISSAYFKTVADHREDAYLLTGDPANLSERQRLDTAAGVSLVVAEVSLAIFSYFLMME